MSIQFNQLFARWFFTLVFLLSGSLLAQAGASESIYQLPVNLKNQQGEVFNLRSYEGERLVVTMFYGTCKHICPVLVKTLKQLDDRLSEAERKQVRILMVSLDPERDNPQALQQLAEKFDLPAARWTLAQPQPEDVRLIAAVLGIKYRKLPNGEFNHTSEMVLFDAAGLELGRSNQMGQPAEPFVTLVKQALKPGFYVGQAR